MGMFEIGPDGELRPAPGRTIKVTINGEHVNTLHGACLQCGFEFDAHQPDPNFESLGSPPLLCPPECDVCYGTGEVDTNDYTGNTDDCDNCGGKGYL